MARFHANQLKLRISRRLTDEASKKKVPADILLHMGDIRKHKGMETDETVALKKRKITPMLLNYAENVLKDTLGFEYNSY